MTDMRDIAVIDCETDPFKKGRFPAPFIWGFYDGSNYKEFSTTKELVKFLSSKNIIVYAHNGGKFDYHFMFNYLTPFDTELMVINGRVAKFKIGSCEFRDSYNIIPVALKQFEKMEFDYSKLEKDVRHLHMDEIREYLQSDCVNLYTMVTEFIERFGFHLTQATAAFKTWQKLENRRPPKSDIDYYKNISQYYYGGRVQCFQTGVIKKKFELYDINSAYPYAMLSNHPISISYNMVDGESDYKTGDMFFHVKAISKGAFPFRNEEGKLVFPNDNEIREYRITGWELLTAIETNTAEIIEYISTLIYNETISFENYILHFYNMRKEAKEKGDKAGDLFSKLLMNSLYGKFGSNPQNYSNYVVVPPDCIDAMQEDGYKYSGDIGTLVLGQRPLDDDEMKFYNVATSASITGFVRAYLWRALNSCKNPLYCDTDSIAAESFVESPYFKVGNELGQWKLEGKFDKAGISGKKLYIFRGIKENGIRKYKTASKGVRLSHIQLWKLANGGCVDVMNEVPTYSVRKEAYFTTRHIKPTIGE